MIERNVILEALHSPAKTAQLASPVSAAMTSLPGVEALTDRQREAITTVIDTIRGGRATLDMMRDSGSIPPRVRAALAAAEIYAGCAIAELRSTFLNYGKPI